MSVAIITRYCQLVSSTLGWLTWAICTWSRIQHQAATERLQAPSSPPPHRTHTQPQYKVRTLVCSSQWQWHGSRKANCHYFRQTDSKVRKMCYKDTFFTSWNISPVVWKHEEGDVLSARQIVPFPQSYSQLYFLLSPTHYFHHTSFTSQWSNDPRDWRTVADRYLTFTAL